MTKHFVSQRTRVLVWAGSFFLFGAAIQPDSFPRAVVGAASDEAAAAQAGKKKVSKTQLGATGFGRENFRALNAYNPMYNRFIPGIDNQNLILIDTVAQNEREYELPVSGRPLGFMESTGGLFFAVAAQRKVYIYWCDTATDDIDEQAVVSIPGEVVFHDGLVAPPDPSFPNTAGVNRDWFFAFIVLDRGVYKTVTWSSIGKFQNKTVRESPSEPRAFYIQLASKNDPLSGLRFNYLEKNVLGKWVYSGVAPAGDTGFAISGQDIQTARFFDAGGKLYIIYVTGARTVFMQSGEKSRQLLQSNNLGDIQEIRLGLYKVDKRLFVEFYFGKRSGGIVRTGRLPLQTIASPQIDQSAVDYFWTAPYRQMIFGYWGDTPGFFLAYTDSMFAFETQPEANQPAIVDVRTSVRTSQKGLELTVRWDFNTPVAGQVNYSYGLTKSYTYAFPEPFFTSARRSVTIVVQQEGTYYLHMRAQIGKRLSKALHIPVHVYQRLPKVKVFSPNRVGPSLYYFKQENMILRVAADGPSDLEFRYYLSERKLKNPSIRFLRSKMDPYLPVLALKVVESGRRYLYISAFSGDGRLYSEPAEFELWTEGNRLAKLKSINQIDRYLYELESLYAIIKSSGSRLKAQDKKNIRTKIQRIQKQIEQNQ